MITITHASCNYSVELSGEDRWFEDPERRIFAVFDGMGGGTNGAMAAELAAQELQTALSDILTINSTERIKTLIREALRRINAKIHAKGTQKIDAMGTTASLCHISTKGRQTPIAIIGHVGDSRTYILREKKIFNVLTLDDSVLSRLCRSAEIAARFQNQFSSVTKSDELSDSEFPLFHMRNYMASVLGDEHIIPHVVETPIQPGDRLLLSTDGIHDNLTNQELHTILADTTSAKEAAEQLVDSARIRSAEKHFRSKDDDMTAIVIDIV